MQRRLVIALVLSSMAAFAAVETAWGQDRTRDYDRSRRPDREEEEQEVFYYRIQKRGGGGKFNGWFLDIDRKARVTRGASTNLTTSWHAKDSTTTWEVRPAGQFNGVDAVYIVNKGDSKFEDWYLALDPKTNAVTMHQNAEDSTTKWLLRWIGKDGKYDLYQIRNAGLTPLTGALLSMTVQDQDNSTGTARNVSLAAEARDPLTFWSLQRFTPEDVADEESRY